MGTRSITVVKEGNETLATIYRQYDGYPTGHGQDLVNILKPRTMVNGISGNAKAVFNGPGCMAAQIIRQLKDDEAGGVYMVSANNDYMVDYVYIIIVNREGDGFELTYNEPEVIVESFGEELFTGNVAEFEIFCLQD